MIDEYFSMYSSYFSMMIMNFVTGSRLGNNYYWWIYNKWRLNYSLILPFFIFLFTVNKLTNGFSLKSYTNIEDVFIFHVKFEKTLVFIMNSINTKSVYKKFLFFHLFNFFSLLFAITWRSAIRRLWKFFILITLCCVFCVDIYNLFFFDIVWNLCWIFPDLTLSSNFFLFILFSSLAS